MSNQISDSKLISSDDKFQEEARQLLELKSAIRNMKPIKLISNNLSMIRESREIHQE